MLIRWLSLCLFLLCSTPFSGISQDTKRIPALEEETPQVYKNGWKDAAKTLSNSAFSPEFVYTLSDTLNPAQPNTYLQGICWTGSEFWIGIWGGNYQGSIYRVDAMGRNIGPFSVIGITGITGMTVHENSVFAVNETDKIYEIDKNTRRRLSTLTIAGSARPTFITYSPDLDNGNGGFFMANFELNSPLYRVSLGGEVLDSIPAAIHGQRVMTGAAYDASSPGGPYLWVFNQALPNNPSEAVISQLDAATGQATDVNYDVIQDFGNANSAAGGLFLSDEIVANKLVLGGILQSSPADLMIGYELDFQLPPVDAALQSLQIDEGIFQIPAQHRSDFHFSGLLKNKGLETLTQVIVELQVSRAENDEIVFMGKDTLENLEFLDELPFQLGPWVGTEVGQFTVSAEVNTGGQIDETLENNILVQDLYIGDSTIIMDDGVEAGGLGLGFGAENGSYFGQVFPAQEELFDYLTSISFKLKQPQKGDQVLASVFDMDPETGRPTSIPVASTITYQITQRDQDSGVFITLPLADGPYPIFPGEFFIAVKEGERPLSLSYSEDIFRAGERFVRTDTVIEGSLFDGDWVEIESVFDGPLEASLMIYPNFGYCVPTYMEASIEVSGDKGDGDGTATVSVTGGSGVYSYVWNDPLGQTTATATGLAKNEAYTVTVTDTTGCVVHLTSEAIPNLVSRDDFPGIGIVSLDVHPNPAYEDLLVRFTLEAPDEIQVSLLNINGQKVFSDNSGRTFQYDRRIYIDDLAAGVYILELESSKGRFRQRIMLR